MLIKIGRHSLTCDSLYFRIINYIPDQFSQILKNIEYDLDLQAYEIESGNYVKNGKVFDSSGNFISKYSPELAKNYHNAGGQFIF